MNSELALRAQMRTSRGLGEDTITFVRHRSVGYAHRHMIIGDRLRQLREEKKLSQGDIEKKTGLLRCYISRPVRFT
jgi:hypothetical protein